MAEETIAERVSRSLPDNDSSANVFISRYADLFDQAAKLDDLEIVRMGIQAEKLEAKFRAFAHAYPADVPVSEDGEVRAAFLRLARLNRVDRRITLQRMANFYRKQARQKQKDEL